MSKYARAGSAVAESESPATAIEIEVMGRWDALALSEHLLPYRSFLVQHERERWVVHARVPGCRGETLADAVRAIDDWATERGVERASCRIDGRPRGLDGSVRE
jgi:hypothetical protein